MNRRLITIKNLSFAYTCPGSKSNTVLNNISFDIHAQERLAILGANGSGKSTLLGCLCGLITPPPGTVSVYDDARIAVVLQNPDDQIIGSIVEEDTAFGPENQKLDKEEQQQRVNAALLCTGLEARREQQVRFLSGGEKQRLALAGALALDTEIIVLDEAVSMLDPKGREDFILLLDKLSAAGKTIVQVTHSLEEAFSCRRCLVLKNGSIVFDGASQELLKQKELESWGFSVPQAVKVFNLFPIGAKFSFDPARAAEHIAAALEAGATPRVFAGEQTMPLQTSLNDSAFCKEPYRSVLFDNASHQYSKVLPGGINNVSFETAPGELIALVGRSGSGKTTVLKHINALLLPKEGRVVVLGKDTLDKKTSLAHLRAKAALLIQSPESALFEYYVADDVAFGPRNSGLCKEELVFRVKAAMEKTGLPFEEFADRRPLSLSGGEKRRAAIAGTAAMESELLLLDEPFAGLDGFNKKKIRELIDHYRGKGKTVIISTHSMETAAWADKVGVMVEGRLAAFSTPREIFGPCWDAQWGLSLPWIAALSRCLAAHIPSAAIPLTPEELLSCLEGNSSLYSVVKNKATHIGEGEAAPTPPPDNRRTAKRRKTGIEFFRLVSFDKLPPSVLQNASGSIKFFLLLVLTAAALVFPPPWFPLGVLVVVIGAGWFGGKAGPVHLLRGFFRILPWLIIVGAAQLAINFDPMRPLSLVLRIASFSALLSLFCAVTPLRQLMQTINRLLSIFTRIGFPVRDFSLAAGIVLRFIPILSEEAERIVSAQLSRGANKGRLRLAFSLIVPLFLRALERAETLVKAMLLRGYR